LATLFQASSQMTFPASAGTESVDKATGLDGLSKEAAAAINNRSINKLHHFRRLGKESNCSDGKPGRRRGDGGYSVD
jgi:hypothetical protein